MKNLFIWFFYQKKKKSAWMNKRGETCLFVRGIFGMFICERTTDDRVSIWEWKKKMQPLYRILIHRRLGKGVEGFYCIFFFVMLSRCGRKRRMKMWIN